MLSEEAKTAQKLLGEVPYIEKAIITISNALRRGGRLLYIGAGTSGRLGMLDAAECPPTFGTRARTVQGILAGGPKALNGSVEGAEDEFAGGARQITARRVSKNDVVVGIAASGTTPFVWGALTEAKRRKAACILLCFHPYLRIPRAIMPDIVIAPNLGPEVLTGSTRLKAGTATKLLLNLFSTLAMVRLGKVRSNLMIDLDPGNTKLRDRATRIVRELTGTDQATAHTALVKSRWVIRKALDEIERFDKRSLKRERRQKRSKTTG